MRAGLEIYNKGAILCDHGAAGWSRRRGYDVTFSTADANTAYNNNIISDLLMPPHNVTSNPTTITSYL